MKPLDKPLWFFSRIEFSFISFTLKFLVFSLESKVAKHNLHIREVIWSFFISNIYNIPFTTYNTMLWRKMMLICYKGRNARIQTHEIHLTCKDYFYKAGARGLRKRDLATARQILMWDIWNLGLFPVLWHSNVAMLLITWATLSRKRKSEKTSINNQSHHRPSSRKWRTWFCVWTMKFERIHRKSFDFPLAQSVNGKVVLSSIFWSRIRELKFECHWSILE